eukprot:8405484-Pyramimonas_sp.AAC.1
MLIDIVYPNTHWHGRMCHCDLTHNEINHTSPETRPRPEPLYDALDDLEGLGVGPQLGDRARCSTHL